MRTPVTVVPFTDLKHRQILRGPLKALNGRSPPLCGERSQSPARATFVRVRCTAWLGDRLLAAKESALGVLPRAVPLEFVLRDGILCQKDWLPRTEGTMSQRKVPHAEAVRIVDSTERRRGKLNAVGAGLELVFIETDVDTLVLDNQDLRDSKPALSVIN